MTALTFRVVGTPAPQGSKRHVGNGVMVESSAKVKPWRQDVAAAAREAVEREGWTCPSGAVSLHIAFLLARPLGHYGTGRNAGVLKDSAPFFVSKRPDLSKLVRSTEDALTTAGVYRDDNQVVAITTTKTYSDDGVTGAVVTVRALGDAETTP